MTKKKLDEHTIDRLAKLAYLSFEPDEKQSLLNDLNKMVSFVEKLNELDTSNVEPLIYPNEEEGILRPDLAQKPLEQADALKNAPDKSRGMFRVPLYVSKE
jgi:aspartyl-tRNA(Asn)/glutamyl-tRNA(Gln) amidotransferase subunit C